MEKLRVVQWTTGKVGKCALRAILDDPGLELVGAFAYSDDKSGQDAAALADRPACGVTATNDVQALVDLAPDAVVYTPFMADLDHVESLLKAGIDIVSTNLFLNCGGVTGETRDRIAAACKAGGSSFCITGVNPGWINALSASLTAVCRRVDTITIAESADVSNYASKETWEALGMGLTELNDGVLAAAQGAMVSFRDAVQRVADATGIELDAIDFEIEHARVSEAVELGYMTLEEGSFGALRSAWVAKVAGREVIRLSVAWYLTEKLAEGWTFDDDHYFVEVTGEPGVEMRIKFVAPEWQGGDWSVLTALPAVSAVRQVVAAPSGILGLEDLPLVAAPVGAWMKARA